MFASLRARHFVALTTLLAFGACKEGPSMKEAAEKAEEKDAAEKKAKAEADAKLAAQAKAAKEATVENPWSFDDVKAKLTKGTILRYQTTGTDAKGEPVEDGVYCEVLEVEDLDVQVLEYDDSQKDVPAVTQPQGHPWANLSPFFWVEQAEFTPLRKETVEVPAGSFECVVADMKDFFGRYQTVWMIIDKPGIYAQVVEHPNYKNAEEGDQTEIIHKLASAEHRQ